MLFGVETGLDNGDKALIVGVITALGVLGDRVWSWYKGKSEMRAAIAAERERRRLEREKTRADLEETDEAADFEREIKREGIATRALKQAYDKIAELHEEIKALLIAHREEMSKYILQNNEFREQLQITQNRLAVCEENRRQQDVKIAALEKSRPGGPR